MEYTLKSNTLFIDKISLLNGLQRGEELAFALLYNQYADLLYSYGTGLGFAKEDIEDKRQGFNLGADDYMVKPINIDELILRVKSLLRRSNQANERKIKIGEVELDYDKLEVKKQEKVYQLTQKEFYLLYKLLSTPDTIYKRQDLIEEIWGLENNSDFRTVDVHIKRLREKLEDIKEFEIVTIRGIGYKAIIK